MSSSTIKTQRPHFTCQMKDMNNSKLFLISAEDVLTTEHVGRDTDLTGRMVEMISFVGEQRFTVSLWELLRCHPILIYLTGVEGTEWI